MILRALILGVLFTALAVSLLIELTPWWAVVLIVVLATVRQHR